MVYYEKPTNALKKLKEEKGYYPKPDDFTPNPDYPKKHIFYGRLRCHGWNPRHGRQCLGMAMVKSGLDKCKRHGGESPRGMSSPHFKHGKFSKVIPKNMAQDYEDFLNDPDYLNMGSHIAVLNSRISDIFRNINTDGGYVIFKNLKKEFAAADRSNMMAKQMGKGTTERAETAAKAAVHLNNVRDLIDQGEAHWQKFFEIDRLSESVRRMTDTEIRRIKAAQTSITMEAHFLDLYLIQLAIKNAFPKRKERQIIQREYDRLTGQR